MSEAPVSWPPGQAGKRQKQVLQQGAFRKLGQPGLQDCKGWGWGANPALAVLPGKASWEGGFE